MFFFCDCINVRKGFDWMKKNIFLWLYRRYKQMKRYLLQFFYDCIVVINTDEKVSIACKKNFYMILSTSQTQMKRYLMHVKTVFWVFDLWLLMFETQMKRFLLHEKKSLFLFFIIVLMFEHRRSNFGTCNISFFKHLDPLLSLLPSLYVPNIGE